jgi:maltose/moltooligosaccharide transporter
MQKPKLSFWNIWNMSFGFLGVQIGFSLQGANTSGIFSALGADPHQLPLFWLGAPLAGLVVQPIIGLSSDKTWTRLKVGQGLAIMLVGRRIPFILLGAVISMIAMFLMPNAEQVAYWMSPLLFGAFMLLLMDTSFNITMQPFRSLVSDMLPDEQKNLGYSIQSFLINLGAIVGFLLPFVLTWMGVSNAPKDGAKVADSVIWSYYFGGGVLLLAVLWTAFRTREYPPDEFAHYNNQGSEAPSEARPSFGSLLSGMPKAMLQLGFTQFFSWFALFMMWVYTTDTIAIQVWRASDSTSSAYNDARNWTGVIFAVYSVVAAIYSLAIPALAKSFGRKGVYGLSLAAAGIGLASMRWIEEPNLLFAAMIGVGVGWAAILALPYAILSSRLPAAQTGVYMGLFNATITLPQIAAGLLGGLLFQMMGNSSPNMMVVAGVSMLVAAVGAWVIVEDQR